MNAEKQRIVFNLNEFIEDLCRSLEQDDIEKDITQQDYVEDVLSRYKAFINHSSLHVIGVSKQYLSKHPTVIKDKRIRSFIESCYVK